MSKQSWFLILGLVLAVGARYWVAGMKDDQTSFFNNGKKYVKEIHESSSLLYARLYSSGLGEDQGNDINYFFNQRAIEAHLGSVQTSEKLKTGNRSRPYDDQIFTLTFLDQDISTRQYIANFMYNCEVLMQRLRTTSLRVRAADPSQTRDRPLPTGTKRDEWWKIESIEFTRRTPTEQAN